jgi:hypothetical protein
MYHAKLSVVLSECEDQTVANAELKQTNGVWVTWGISPSIMADRI